MKGVILLFLFLLILTFFTSTITPQEKLNLNTTKHCIDYRNHANIPPYDASLMPMNTTRTTTGVWTELNPKIPRVDYIGVDFIDTLTGWCVGKNGAIIKTTDGGKNWINCTSNTTEVLLKVSSYNGNVVIVSGYNGMILRSSDYGITFTQVYNGGSNIDLWGLQMLNDTLGWCCGRSSRLLKTTNGGLTWQQVNTGYSGIDYWSLDFLNTNYGMISCGGGRVIKTTDGGNSWTILQAGDSRALYTIDIIDTSHIASSGATGKNVYSSDGGINWIQNGDLGNLQGSNRIRFISTDTGYVTGDLSELRKTTNRGQDWFAPINPAIGEWDFDLVAGGAGYGVGSGLTITRGCNGYDYWERIVLNENFIDVYFKNENEGWFVSRDDAYKTNDGGLTVTADTILPGGTVIYFINSLTGFYSTNSTPVRVLKTTNGGISWYQVNTMGLGFGKIFFINPQIGWALSGGKILMTTDCGENWFIQHTLPADSYTSIYFVDSLNGWATSRYIWQTTNGGTNWIQRSELPMSTYDDVYFENINKGWIGRYSSINSSLFKTSDGGLTWNAVAGVIGARKFFRFPDPIHWMIIGFSQYYITNDYGNTWFEFTSIVPSGLVSLHAPTNLIGYSVGKSGLILKYLDTSYVPVELIHFSGFSEEGKVILSWKTATEINNQGFYIERSFDNLNWQTIGFIKGNNSNTEITDYSFVDNEISFEKYYYRLKQLDYNGSYDYSNTIEVFISINTFHLFQNYPNPFNSTTNIKFSVPIKTKIKITLFDMKGEKIIDLVNDEKDRGIYTERLNIKNLSTGIYLYRLTTSSGYTATKKLIFIK